MSTQNPTPADNPLHTNSHSSPLSTNSLGPSPPPTTTHNNSQHILQDNHEQPLIPSSHPFRHYTHASNPPSYLADYHCYHATYTLPISHLKFLNPNIAYPLSFVLSYDKCSPSYDTFCCAISSISESTTYKQASQHVC